MKILVLGGGQIASAVRLAAPPTHEVVVRRRDELDITDSDAVARTLAAERASWIVNAAAFTDVERAEAEPTTAISTNDIAVRSLAFSADRQGARLLHLSTDFVFDGKTNRAYLPLDQTNPLNIYGFSKASGERHVTANPDGIVLRTSWVYATTGKNFVLTMLKLMRERERIGVVADQISSPTWATSAASAVWACIELEIKGGIYHWADLGVASWYDFAVAVQDEALERGLLTRAASVFPIPSSEYPSRAKRPAFSSLDTSSTRGILNAPARHWRHNLRAMLDELRAS